MLNLKKKFIIIIIIINFAVLYKITIYSKRKGFYIIIKSKSTHKYRYLGFKPGQINSQHTVIFILYKQQEQEQEQQ